MSYARKCVIRMVPSCAYAADQFEDRWGDGNCRFPCGRGEESACCRWLTGLRLAMWHRLAHECDRVDESSKQ